MCLPTLISVVLFSSLVSAAVILPPSAPSRYTPRAPQTLPVLVGPININNTFSPSANAIRFQCKENYGRNLNPGSCRDIFTYIKKSDDQNTFSERHTGRPNDLPLPDRIVSNDGLCFIQPLLVPGAVTAKASMTQIGQAAYVLFQRCVVEKGLGGIAADIGASVFPYKLAWFYVSSPSKIQKTFSRHKLKRLHQVATTISTWYSQTTHLMSAATKVLHRAHHGSLVSPSLRT